MSDAPATGLRERNKRKRIDLILSAAAELLVENSADLTVPRIAARAEVSPTTVFNLIGTREQIWEGLTDRALAKLDLRSVTAANGHARARAIVDEIVRVICADAGLFRALVLGYSRSGRVLDHDPTDELVACLAEAAESGELVAGLNLRRVGELLCAGLIGLFHEWGAHLLSDRALRARARDLVDVAFAAIRASDAPEPTWHRDMRDRRSAHA